MNLHRPIHRGVPLILNTTAVQAGATGTQYTFSNWSDNSTALPHTVNVAYLTYTANFTTQYYLTTSASSGGAISPSNCWYNSGASVPVTATPATGYQFVGFSGNLAGATTPQNLTMSGPMSVSANFGTATTNINPTSGPGPTTFSYVFTDPNGPNALTQLSMLINWDTNGYGGCYVIYRQDMDEIFLLANDGYTWQGFVPPGTPNVTLSNSQCNLNVGASSVTNNGTTLTVNLSLTFTSSFVGDHNVYAYSVGSLWSGWQLLANYQAYSGPVITFNPSSASFDAPGGQGSTSVQTSNGGSWTAVASDTWIHITPPTTGTGDRTLAYTVDANQTANIRTGSINLNGSAFWIFQGPSATYGFSLTASPATQTIIAGYASYTIAVGGSPGFNLPVAFSLSGAPSGAYFSPATVTGSGNTSLIIPSASAGTYNITVTGTCSGCSAQTVWAWLNVLPVGSPPDFSILASAAPQIVAPGNAATYNVSLASIANFSGSVNLTATGLPSGASTRFTPDPASLTPSGTATPALLVSTSSWTPTGTFPITLTATGNGITHATMVFLTVATASPATMLTPAAGSNLISNTATFTWNPGIGATQYQLTLGSTQGASNYYSGTAGSARSVTVDTIPVGSQTQTIYATLNSLISGAWQSRSYTYTSSDPPPVVPMSVQLKSADQQGYVLNDDNPQTWSYCVYTRISPLDPWVCDGTKASGNLVTSCTVQTCFRGRCTPDPDITATPSGPNSTENSADFYVTFIADFFAAPGSRTLTCTYAGSMPDLQVYDATPQITYVQQLQPLYPGGTAWITIYGTDLGPSTGTVSICTHNSNPCQNPGITATTPTPYGTWFQDRATGYNQVNVLLSASSNTQVGSYDVQLTSSGESGNGFVALPGGSTNTTTDPGQVTVSQINVTQSPSQLYLSTGDTDKVITTGISPGNIQFTPTFAFGLQPNGNPDSSCTANLGNSSNGGTGSVNSVITAGNPQGQTSCSGIFSALAVVSNVSSNAATQVVVPPLLLIQMLWGEANGQSAITRMALGTTVINRFSQPQWFSAVSTWQGALTIAQYNGIGDAQAQGINNGVYPQLYEAAALFTGTPNSVMPYATQNVANAGCFFTPNTFTSPDGTDWPNILSVYNQCQADRTSSACLTPPATSSNDAKCYNQRRQYVWKATVDTNAGGVPAFVFVQERNPDTDPAVIQIN